MHSAPFISGLQVIFGAGPVGLALAHELVTKEKPVRLVTRSGRGASVAGVDRVAADASDRTRAATAASGAQVVYHAVGASCRHPDTIGRQPLAVSRSSDISFSASVSAAMACCR